MRRGLQFACLALWVAAAGACNPPTKPSDPNGLAATLQAFSVVPPVIGAEAQSTGVATISLQLMRDSSGTITSATATFQVTLTNLPSGTAITQAHIHLGDLGVPGGILVDTGLIDGEVTVVNGNVTFTHQGIVIPNNVAQELLASPISFYFDVHSVRNPDGIVRGQLSH